MGASYDILRAIVRNGNDLTLCQPVNYDTLRELATLAKQSGAKLTIPTSLNYDVIRELLASHGNSISFVDGLDHFQTKAG